MKTCGVCSSNVFKRFDIIVEFTEFENCCGFDRKGKDNIETIENYKIKVTIEGDLVCGAV